MDERLAQVSAVARSAKEETFFEAVWIIDSFDQLMNPYHYLNKEMASKRFSIPLPGGKEPAAMTVCCTPRVEARLGDQAHVRVRSNIEFPSYVVDFTTSIASGLLERSGKERVLNNYVGWLHT
jgi:hypothetical protein